MENVQLRSTRSTTKTFVRFFNGTSRDVDIIWVNFSGDFVKYTTISPDQFVDVNTYTGHPWMFLDSKTRDKMCVRGRNVFLAAPKRDHHLFHHMPFVRFSLRIHLPVYSLKMCALLRVRDLLKSVESVSQLELPAALKKDLQTAFMAQNVNLISAENSEYSRQNI